MPPLPLSNVLGDSLQEALSRYPDDLPSTLHELDTLRYTTIPAAISAKSRKPHGHLTSSELVQLVDWKLKHGKFRPSLLKLAKENSEEKVQNTTAAAFAHIAKATPSERGSDLPWKAIELAMSDVVELRGVGPATASLILSCFDRWQVPFFSDELFRLLHWMDEPSKGKERGWDRKIAYTMKEYQSLVERLREFQGLLKKSGKACSYQDVEKAAWAMGKDGVNVGALAEDENGTSFKPGMGDGKRAGRADLKVKESPKKETEKRKRDVEDDKAASRESKKLAKTSNKSKGSRSSK